MSDLSSVSGRYWFPLGTRHRYGRPEAGWVVAFDHQAWLIAEVRDHEADTLRPYRVRLRPAGLVNHPDPVKAKARDRHIGVPRHYDWNVFPDPEHYPVCACCSEPMPCRSEEGRKTAEREIAQMSRFETPGVCPACEQPVTARQKSLTFAGSLEVPGGPDVVFHSRRRCVREALDYERRWVAVDPENRRPTLYCEGHLTNHNDGTYDCSATAPCPGPHVAHPSYAVCTCQPCHAKPWTSGRGCQPASNAQLRRSDAA